ncbi:MAG: hypothetical protein ACTSYB_19395 [Candidatus Helarchaeota archaeon]
MPYTYADLPDDAHSKRFLPLGRHLWRLYKAVGWDYLHASLDIVFPEFYDMLHERFDNTLKTAQMTLEGKIAPENAQKTLAYQLFPPLACIRSDLQQGTMKLIYGESCDITFVTLDDNNSEISFLFNGHCEGGIPVDWWLVEHGNELLERRHQKYGYKLKDLYVKTKNMVKTGMQLIDILRDIRNERAPQFANSTYQVAMVWGSAAVNLLYEPSTYEIFAGLWDGLSTKSYGLPDYYFCYVPSPPLVNTLVYLGRANFSLRMAGLSTDLKLYLQGIEKSMIKVAKEKMPEAWEVGTVQNFKNGIPRPKHTLTCKLPNLKDKKTYEREEFDWHYEHPDCFIHIEDLGMSVEEALEGVYLDIDHETPYEEKIDESKIISTGIGIHTKIRK